MLGTGPNPTLTYAADLRSNPNRCHSRLVNLLLACTLTSVLNGVPQRADIFSELDTTCCGPHMRRTAYAVAAARRKFHYDISSAFTGR